MSSKGVPPPSDGMGLEVRIDGEVILFYGCNVYKKIEDEWYSCF